MAASLYDILLGSDPSSAGAAAELARRFRQQQGLGNVLQLTGDRVIAPVGQQLTAEAVAAPEQIAGTAAQRQRLLLTRQELEQRRAAAEQEAAARAAQQGHAAAQLAEAARHNRATEAATDAAREQDAWAFVADPVMGGFVRGNRKTGEMATVRGPQPAATPPATSDPAAPAPPDVAGFKMTEPQAKAFAAVNRMREARRQMEGAGYPSGLGGRKDAWATGASGGVMGKVTPQEAASEEGQRYFTAGRNLIAALLRKESGAAITRDEWEQLGPLYIPMPWDDEATRANKIRMLDVMEQSAVAESGPAAAAHLGPTKTSSASTSTEALRKKYGL